MISNLDLVGTALVVTHGCDLMLGVPLTLKLGAVGGGWMASVWVWVGGCAGKCAVKHTYILAFHQMSRIMRFKK